MNYKRQSGISSFILFLTILKVAHPLDLTIPTPGSSLSDLAPGGSVRRNSTESAIESDSDVEFSGKDNGSTTTSKTSEIIDPKLKEEDKQSQQESVVVNEREENRNYDHDHQATAHQRKPKHHHLRRIRRELGAKNRTMSDDESNNNNGTGKVNDSPSKTDTIRGHPSTTEKINGNSSKTGKNNGNSSKTEKTEVNLSRVFAGVGGESSTFEARYLDETEINNPILKHYDDDSNFYPPWTYYGFFSPTQWGDVPIEYFTRPSRADFDGEQLRRHRSAMHICSAKVTSDAKKCFEITKNECINDIPSPIDIIEAEATEDEGLRDFEFLHFDTFFGFTMFIPEDGTDLLTLTFDYSKADVDRKPSASEGSVGNHDLFLDRIIFHFGYDSNKGSEHTINGKYFGMEIQVYFTGDKAAYWESLAKYKFMKATNPLHGDNMHVFSVMVQVSPEDYSAPKDDNGKFSTRFEILSLVAMMFIDDWNTDKHRAVRVSQKLISLEYFLGKPSKGKYYTYEGSLTTPPCLKHAKWTIFETPIWITYEQWARFYEMKSEFSDRQLVAGNNRRMDEILVRLSVPAYVEMRRVEGMAPLTQSDVDREVKYETKNGTLVELYILRRYSDFPKSYARKVTKSVAGTGKEASETDYYDLISDSNSGQYLDFRLAPIIVMLALSFLIK